MQTQKFPKISLAAARVNAGLNQQEAAKALGVSVATLQNYESGKTVPQWGTVQKIERVYKFPADFIFYPRIRFKRTTSKFRSLTLSTAAKIADHFGVRIDDLVEHS